MKKVSILLPGLAVLGNMMGPLPATAQEAELRVVLAQQGGGIRSQSSVASITIPVGESRALVVECTAPIPCSEIAARITSAGGGAGAVLAASPGRTEREVRFEIEGRQVPVTGANGTLIITGANGVALANFPIGRSTATQATRSCTDASAWVSESDLVDFVATSMGNVYYRTPRAIREGEDVTFRIIAPESRLAALRIQRASAARPVGGINILGAGVTTTDLRRFAAEDCGALTVTLGDFASGEARVTIEEVNPEDGTARTLGTITFAVRALYTGAFSFGAIRTRLANPSIGLVASGPDSVIAVTSGSEPRVLYVIFYTPFIWGRRDVEASLPLISLERLNPTVGVVVDDVTKNAVVGIAYDFSSHVYVIGGRHFGEVRGLNPESGLQEGSVFTGNQSQIPTSTTWKGAWFGGVSIDIRAAVQLLQMVF